ncbi:MAG: MarR family winged helix-turn-helix transcriptional regulator [Pseudomonadota bacterium]
MSETPSYRLAEHICHQTYALDRALARAYQVAFGKTGFTYPKFIVLMALEEGGAMGVGALSQVVGVETNTLSPLLKKMAAAGIITRARSQDDERQVVVEMTAYGEAVLAKARAAAAEIYTALGLTESDALALTQALSKLREAASHARPTPMELPPR